MSVKWSKLTSDCVDSEDDGWLVLALAENAEDEDENDDDDDDDADENAEEAAVANAKEFSAATVRRTGRAIGVTDASTARTGTAARGTRAKFDIAAIVTPAPAFNLRCRVTNEQLDTT
ncbi:hypothetical protein HDU82_007270 [Entophlyctis luteolus]|nr:hypothetical protein HDU82_007270 [Entophlyctis luteolus]